MRDRLIEISREVHNVCHYRPCEYCNYSKLKPDCINLALADCLIENGVIVPPCKVGDILYDIYEGEKIEEIKVTKIKISFDERNKPWLIIGGYYYSFDDFGKTVFHTKEEAEKALRGD